MLDIIFEFRRGILFVRMNGVLSKNTYLKYKDEVLFMIKENGIRNVVLNLENVNEIDLKGINALFYTYELVRDNNGYLMISNINKNIEKRISKSHLLKYVNTLNHEIESFSKVIV
jgi:stage II sporulation protein AA (anti-sigma F factor antagonist)